MKVQGLGVSALLLVLVSCATESYRWIQVEEAPEATPAETAMHKGHLVDSFSMREWDESAANSGCRYGVIDLSVLLTNDSIWVGKSTGTRIQIGVLEGQEPHKKQQPVYDWEAFHEVLQDFREDPDFAGPPVEHRIELAASDGIAYEKILAAMDHMIATDFRRISFMRPRYLSGIPREFFLPNDATTNATTFRVRN